MAVPSTKISILMPVCNCERFVAEAIESILAQSYQEFEFIIVDDGSTDKSLDIIKFYAIRDKRIKLVSRPNTGIVGALNDGIAIAQGQYLARMDADDIAMPNRLDIQLNYLNSNRHLVGVGSYVELCDESGLGIWTYRMSSDAHCIENALLDGNAGILVHPATMFTMQAIQEIGGYHERWNWAEDFDFYLRLLEIGKLSNVPEVLLRYRQNSNSTNFTHSAAQRTLVLERVNIERKKLSMQPLDQLPGPSHVLAPGYLHLRWSEWALGDRRWKASFKHALISISCNVTTTFKVIKVILRVIWGCTKEYKREKWKISESA